MSSDAEAQKRKARDAVAEKKLQTVEKSIAEKQKEIDAIKAQMKVLSGDRKAESQPLIKGGYLMEVIVSAKAAKQLQALGKGVAVEPVQGPGYQLVDRAENVLIVSCEKGKLEDVIKICQAELVKKRQKPPPAPAPKFGAKQHEDSDDEKEEKKELTEEEKEEKKKAEEEKKKKEKEEEERLATLKIPDADMEVKTDMNFDEKSWDGNARLSFRWISEPTPFSEFCDPAGTNWWHDTNVRKAPGVTPKKIELEYRLGMTGDWKKLECKIEPNGDGAVELLYKPAEISAGNYRGFQSRWIVDGDKYLSPLQLAPTLQSKLMTYPAVRSALNNLPKDKRSIEHISNVQMRDALMAVENIIPQNTWDLNYGLMMVPGSVLNSEERMNIGEKVSWALKQKNKDPALMSELRGTLLKSPIMAANAAAGFIGVKLDAIVANMSFFIPKLSEPKFEDLENVEALADEWEQLRREMQIDVNQMYPQYQQGLRVSFPSAHILKNSLKCKRPVADVTTKLPIELKWKFTDEKEFKVQHKVQFVYWKGDDYSNKTVVTLDAEEKEEEFGVFEKTTCKTWRKFRIVTEIQHGRWRYHWLLDGEKPYFNDGCPYGEKFKAPQSYLQMEVEFDVYFGIGASF